MQAQTLTLKEVCSFPVGFLFKDELLHIMQRVGDKTGRNLYLTKDVAGGKVFYRLYTDDDGEPMYAPPLRVVIDTENYGGVQVRRVDGAFLPYDIGEFLIYSAGEFSALRKAEDGDLFVRMYRLPEGVRCEVQG